MYEKHMYGKAAEYYAAFYLTMLGYEVTIPNGNPKWDLIIENGQGKLFAQVKSVARNESGDLKVDLRGYRDDKGYNCFDFDLFIIMDRTDNSLYFVPTSDVENNLSVTLKTKAPKVKRPGVRIAEEYKRFDFDYLLHNALVSKIGWRNVNNNKVSS